MVLGQGKAVPVKGLGDLKGYETSRLPHFVDRWLEGGGEVLSLTRRPFLTPE
jgi:hypothetical protein